jgi:hypothetical protein
MKTFRRDITNQAPRPLWPIWRMAAALASFVLVIAGAALQPGQAPIAFASSMELWQQQARVIRILDRVEVMEARVEGEGWIRWRGGALSIEPAGRSLEELARQLEPRVLARRLEAALRWKSSDLFVVSSPDGSSGIEITVDPRTDLPVRLADERRRHFVEFRWTLRPRAENVLSLQSRTQRR